MNAKAYEKLVNLHAYAVQKDHRGYAEALREIITLLAEQSPQQHTPAQPQAHTSEPAGNTGNTTATEQNKP